MVAPVDSRASFDADGESWTLAMNFRTIALAEEARPDVVIAFGQGKPNVSGLALLVWAFAQPAHPDLSQDQALALVLSHGAAIGEALKQVFARAAATPAAGTENPARPRKPGPAG